VVILGIILGQRAQDGTTDRTHDAVTGLVTGKTAGGGPAHGSEDAPLTVLGASGSTGLAAAWLSVIAGLLAAVAALV